MFSSSPPRPPADLPSTQHPSSHPPIPFTQSHPQQTFRLLELPSELLALLSSADPPTLHLKSAPPTLDGAPAAQTASYAHLVSDTQTWQLRQVSTSNSIYVCDTISSTSADDAAPQGALNAIGQCGSVLECLPVAYDVEGMLKRLLPVWRNDTDTEATGMFGKQGMAALHEGIPAPTMVITEACRRLCVVEIEGQAFVPGDEVMLAAWEAGGGGLDVEGCNGAGGELGLVREAVYKALPKEGDGGGLKREETTVWVGEQLLRCSARRGSVGLEEFLGRWRNCVPEAWGGFVRLEGLRKEVYELVENRRQVRWCGEEGGEIVPTDGKIGMEGKKRKWHEKFKEQRNQAKR